MNASEVRSQFREYLDKVERHGDHITIERWGREVAVLVPAAWYERACAALGEPGVSDATGT